MKRIVGILIMGCAFVAQAAAQNGHYSMEVASDGAVTMTAPGMQPQRLEPEFVVLWSETDPICARNPSHPNYPMAPRNAVRWRNPAASLDDLNAWIGSPEFKAVTGMTGVVRDKGTGCEWEHRDAQGKVRAR